MKSFVYGVIAVALLGTASFAWADRVITTNGSAYDVRGFEIGTTAVKMFTPEGKAWSVLKDVVDVGATLKANGMMTGETHSPGWSDAAQSATAPTPEPSKKQRQQKEAEREEKLAKEEAKRQATAERKDQPKEPEPEPERLESRAGTQLTAPARRAPSLPGASELSKFVILVNGGYNGSALNFSSSQTFTLYLENANLQGSYAGNPGLVLEFGAIYRFRGALGAGATVELFGGQNDVTFSESLPHPFFFNRARTLQGTVPGLTYRETAVNVDIVFSRAIGSIIVDGFGGPTFFLTKTQILSDIQYVEAFPYDTVTLQAPVLTQQTDRPLGYNVGGGVTYRLNKWLGAGFSARYNRAMVTVTPAGGTPVNFNAGGIHANGGIRLLF